MVEQKAENLVAELVDLLVGLKVDSKVVNLVEELAGWKVVLWVEKTAELKVSMLESKVASKLVFQ